MHQYLLSPLLADFCIINVSVTKKVDFKSLWSAIQRWHIFNLGGSHPSRLNHYNENLLFSLPPNVEPILQIFVFCLMVLYHLFIYFTDVVKMKDLIK